MTGTLNFNDPSLIPQWSYGISSVICNAIITLWQDDQKDAAKAKVQFVLDKTDFGKAAKNNGVDVYTLYSPDDRLYVHFPNCMFFLIPSSFAAQIIKACFQARKECLEDLEEFDREEQLEQEDSPKQLSLDIEVEHEVKT